MHMLALLGAVVLFALAALMFVEAGQPATYTHRVEDEDDYDPQY